MTRSENKKKKSNQGDKKYHNFLVAENRMDLDAFKLIYIINVFSRSLHWVLLTARVLTRHHSI